MTKAKPSPTKKWTTFPEGAVKGKVSKESLERAVSDTLKMRLANDKRSLADYPQESLEFFRQKFRQDELMKVAEKNADALFTFFGIRSDKHKWKNLALVLATQYFPVFQGVGKSSRGRPATKYKIAALFSRATNLAIQNYLLQQSAESAKLNPDYIPRTFLVEALECLIAEQASVDPKFRGMTPGKLIKQHNDNMKLWQSQSDHDENLQRLTDQTMPNSPFR